MRVAINLLTEDPDNPSVADWFWTHAFAAYREVAERRRRRAS